MTTAQKIVIAVIVLSVIGLGIYFLMQNKKGSNTSLDLTKPDQQPSTLQTVTTVAERSTLEQPVTGNRGLTSICNCVTGYDISGQPVYENVPCVQKGTRMTCPPPPARLKA